MKDPIVIAVGNKVDLEDERAVPNDKITSFCKENNFLFLPTSAKSGENISLLLSTIGKQIYERFHEELED